MSLKLWTMAAKIAGLILTSRTVMDASRTVFGSLKREYRDVEDERLREYLINLEQRLKSAERELESTRKIIKRLTVAVYGLSALALAALAIALIRPA
ncbi:MAG: hypothetical protein K8I01_12745 [Candidatus Methylomirabilis sp.]|nr:hypothetical protein [Deltaproteobacteria bacterium]